MHTRNADSLITLLRVTSVLRLNLDTKQKRLQVDKTKGLSVDEAYIKHILPEKMQYNIDCLKKCSLKNDIDYGKTVIAVLK